MCANNRKELYTAIKEIGLDISEIEKEEIFSIVLGIIKDIYQNEEGVIFIETKNYGEIIFKRASDVFDDELFNKNDLFGGCQEYCLKFLKNHKKMHAVTGICTKSLCLNFYHTFIEDEDEIIDIANNVVMEKMGFFAINSFQKINKVNYQKYLDTKDESKKIDESGDLHDLLRMAIYQQYKTNQKTNSINHKFLILIN